MNAKYKQASRPPFHAHSSNTQYANLIIHVSHPHPSHYLHPSRMARSALPAVGAQTGTTQRISPRTVRNGGGAEENVTTLISFKIDLPVDAQRRLYFSFITQTSPSLQGAILLCCFLTPALLCLSFSSASPAVCLANEYCSITWQ